MSSCSLFTSSTDEDKKQEQGHNPNFPTEQRSLEELAIAGVTPDKSQSLSVSTPEELANIDNEAQGPVFFTDPDNPDADIEGISVAFEGARQRMSWMSKYASAARYARKEKLPLLIWFHDSVISPKSKAMARDLLETPEFLAWMKGKVVGVRLDSSEGFDDMGNKQGSGSTQNIGSLKRRYGIKHLPSFVIISVTGEVVSTIDASDGYLSIASKAIREGVAQAQKIYEFHLDSLREKGYRKWTNSSGSKTLFAKLWRFNRAQDTVYLISDTGRRYKLGLFDFCADDIEYLEALPAEEANPRQKAR